MDNIKKCSHCMSFSNENYTSTRTERDENNIDRCFFFFFFRNIFGCLLIAILKNDSTVDIVYLSLLIFLGFAYVRFNLSFIL